MVVRQFAHSVRCLASGPAYLTVHGHFYQPPREHPATGLLPTEPGAGAYGNFNEKITAECYQPNAEAGNFAHLSFDLAPTLAEYLQHHQPQVYQQILTQENEHYQRFGVSNALAVPYNHTILPLSFHHRDKWLQIRWGLQDYQHRFGHAAQGMWLPETAVDLYTLWTMAYCGIAYTILAPWQAATPVHPSVPYLVHLPRWDKKQRSLVVFFYNRELSGPVSFDSQVTQNADTFAFAELPKHAGRLPQAGLPHHTLIATDGELYGHHKPKRELFLKRLFTSSAREADLTVVSLERYLQLHPAVHEVKIKEYTSWSCHHGVARWETGCDCAEGGGFHSFKASYRAQMRRLYAAAYTLFEEQTRMAIPAYYEARNWYLSLRNGWLPEEEFWQTWGRDQQKPAHVPLVYKTLLMLEADYWLQRSHTSCGTYWAQPGLETNTNLRFAGYAVSLIKLVTGVDLSAYLTW